jgi:Ca2+-transporting ATPase
MAVAAVPEGMPAVVTIALALGVRRMARRRALIRRLPAAETLGGTTVICTDKTGTLTRGEMAVRELYVAGAPFRVTATGVEPCGDAPHAGAYANALREQALVHLGSNNATLYREGTLWKASGDPTEAALLVSARKAAPGLPDEGAGGEVLREYPFDSDVKRHGVLRRLPDGRVRLLVNGAPDLLLDLCSRELGPDGPRPLTADDHRRILEANAAMAERALRVLGSAYRDFEGDFKDFAPGEALPTRAEAERDLVFAGLAGMQDPPRPEAAEAAARCREAGIHVVMITGDHPGTAAAIARELEIAGPGAEAVRGEDLDALDDEALRARVRDVRVFARVTAAHKLRIVNAWRAHGAVVAMTGDGVNDAPALKGADIGIAMGIAGTEVTKQAADLVLADDNFATIVSAVEEGRRVYFNIRKTLQYLLAGNAGELLVMIAALAAGLPLPLLPIHLLWINLITDGLPALVLAADKASPGLMRRGPRPSGEALVNKSFLWGLLGTGLLTAGTSLTAYLLVLQGGDVAAARSAAFDTLVLSEVFRALAYRNNEQPFWHAGFRELFPLLAVAAGVLALQAACHEIGFLKTVLHLRPWTGSSFLMVLGLSVIPLIVLESRKWIRNAGRA